MIVVTIAATVVGYLYLLWVLFLAIMSLSAAYRAGRLPAVVKWFSAPLLITGVAVDVVANLVATVFFLDLPREWTLSRRLSRYLISGSGARRAVADVLGQYLLDPFDPTGAHLKRSA